MDGKTPLEIVREREDEDDMANDMEAKLERLDEWRRGGDRGVKLGESPGEEQEGDQQEDEDSDEDGEDNPSKRDTVATRSSSVDGEAGAADEAGAGELGVSKRDTGMSIEAIEVDTG